MALLLLQMNLPGITWRGESIDDIEILPQLPKDLVSLLAEVNGFILHNGAIHLPLRSGIQFAQR